MNALRQLEWALLELQQSTPLASVSGAISEIAPTHFRVSGLSRFVRLGELIGVNSAGKPQIGEVVRIDSEGIVAKPFDRHFAGGLGSVAYRMPPLSFAPDPSWKGRVINALGAPLDGQGPLTPGSLAVSAEADAPSAMKRARVHKPLRTGVRVIDLFAPICAGQRVGIFAGSGVGKSTLLAMLARSQGFDTVVLALVGERGREVREFIEDVLGNDRQRAVTIVSTGDESPMMRRLAPKTAMAVAEYFRDRGESVLLMVDSITRFAHAAREVALAAGEPAVARGYAPTVFTDLPRLLERAGPGEEGSGTITGIFSVLVDGDDHNEPIADTIRSTLDGHIVLSRHIADQARHPAVDVLASVSRLAHNVWDPEERELVSKLRAMIAKYEDTRDLRLMGGYQAGRDSGLDQAVDMVPKIYGAMRQDASAPPSADPFRELRDMLRGD
ncbi:flagellar protein export ATPase FliI [Bradyrhizobium diazoefficiens]|uniref:flagellar protein export ATPase FliI n=1 Tax=Bradyrhizobium sp. WYCCWR 12699 TaxID=3064203 RepID=UPI001BADD234|nr:MULTISPECIES: flagellar protein export ATPase FliI [Bradyrhizobium]MBR0928380.1 flagellar protein export ATPase FliI [Bradyrhizobium diazoefficiens]MDT4736362.1 flagellar protein export ATPase FliI [Bradyrhizobium sp. WYCCWR 12699]